MANLKSATTSGSFRRGRWVQAPAPKQATPQAPWRRGRAYAAWVDEVPPWDVQQVLTPASEQQPSTSNQARRRRPSSAYAAVSGRKAELARKESLIAFAKVKSAARTSVRGLRPESVGPEDAAVFVPEACQNPQLHAAFLASYGQTGGDFLAGAESPHCKLGYTFVGHHTDIAVNKATGHYVKLISPREAELHKQVLRYRSEALLRELQDDPEYGTSPSVDGAELQAEEMMNAGTTGDEEPASNAVDWGVDLRFVPGASATCTRESRSASGIRSHGRRPTTAPCSRRPAQGAHHSRRS